MRWYFGYPVLAIGLSLAAQMFMPPGSQDFASRAASPAPAAGRAPVVVIAPSGLAAPSRVAAFSPGARFAVPDDASPSVLDYLASRIAGVEPAHAAAPAATKVVTASPWKSAVLRTAERTEPSTIALTRDIQRELKRVGCYGGDVDGVWGGGSRRAILGFMGRVNASLPTSEPDVYILALLRSQDEAVCGAVCPSGQSMTAGGRCHPAAIVAQAGSHGDVADGAETRPRARAMQDVAAADLPTIPQPGGAAFEGRMSIGGPRAGDAVPAVSVTDAEQPAADDGFARTASLETSSVGGSLTGDTGPADVGARQAAAPDSFVGPPAAPKVKSSARAERPKQVRYSSYRHVQHLFEHPLGRM